MSKDDDLRPGKRYVPTERSLDLAESIARAQGTSFDREAIRKLGGNLYEVMFADIIRVLNVDATAITFRSGVYPFARAFSAKAQDGRPAVVLDMVFDYWLFSLTQLVCITIFTVPDEQERRQITADVSYLFELFSYSGDFKTSRRRMARYLLDPNYNNENLKISNLLTRAMIIFVLCHELVHIQLQHLDQPASTDAELRADAHAVSSFVKIVEYGKTNRDTHIYVDPRMAGGPLVMSMIFELYEAWLTARGVDLEQQSTHPPSKDRTAQMQHLMAAELNEPALEIVVGSTHAIRDIGRWLNLPEL